MPTGVYKRTKQVWNKGTKGLCKPNSGSFKKGAKVSEKDKRKRVEGIRKYYDNGGVGPMTGKITSKKTREKISEALKGKIVSEETRRKLSEVNKGKNKGEKSGNWKGGITRFAYQIRNLSECKYWKKKVFGRDYYTCQYSGVKSGNGKTVYLEAHHIKSFSKILEENNITTIKQALECEELWNINNGITLSKEAHKKFHKIYGFKNNTREQLEKFLNCKIYEK